MVDVTAERRPADDSLLRTGAPDLPADVTAPARVVNANTGETVIIVARYPGDLAAYRRAVLGYPMNTTVRAGGIRNRSRVFGFLARSMLMQRNSCRLCSGGLDAPEPHAAICDAAGALAGQLAALNPERAERDRRLVTAAVLADWLIHPEAWWTSGVVNRSSPLPYHRDGNNFDAWSAMVVLRRGVRGGHLHVPEYGVTLECRDGDVVYFNGNDLLHGVTPLRKVDRSGYRYSVVYYPVAKMAGCLPYAEELERGRTARSAGEDDQLHRQRVKGQLASP